MPEKKNAAKRRWNDPYKVPPPRPPVAERGPRMASDLIPTEVRVRGVCPDCMIPSVRKANHCPACGKECDR